MKVLRFCAVAACSSAVALAAVGPGVAASKPVRPSSKPVATLTPVATAKLWRELVSRPRVKAFRTADGCRPLRAVFYAGTDWLRLATKLAANASPCAEYYISVPPLVADKTQPRADQAWRIRALGPNFHAAAEMHVTGWTNWVATTGSSWYAAGVEARRRMAAAGYDVALGDSWQLNELSSAVRRGDGNARANMRAFVRGLYTGDGTQPTKGSVLITGMGQGTTELSVYQARLQDWYEDSGFWTDMAAYASDWSQELYGDVRNYAVPGAPVSARRAALNDYLQHQLALAAAAPASAATARSFLASTYNPLANGAWRWDAAFGWTNVSADEMKHDVSAQTYAMRHFAEGSALQRFGFAWHPKNLLAIPAADFTAQSGEVADRLAQAIRDSAATVDPADPGVGACGPLGQNVWCASDVAGSWFNDGWKSFAAWRPSVLATTTAPQTLTAGAASAPVTVELRTYSGVALPAGVPQPVTVTSTSPAGRFSTAATGPWSSTLSTSIASGSATTSFYYQDTTAGSATITAAAAGKVAASQTVTVSPAALARVAVGPASVSLPRGASQTFSATPTDAYGNAVPATVTWSLSAGTPGALSGTTGPSTVYTASTTGKGTVVATAGDASGTAAIVVPARVASVGYGTYYKDLLITPALTDAAGRPLAGVTVSLSVTRNGVAYAARTGTTGADGRVTVRVTNTPAGCYATTVTGMSAQGWDGTTPTNRFCK